jgi:CRP-like cAMP-binding protein
VVAKGRFAKYIDGTKTGHLLPGSSFGTLALISDAPRPATIKAKEYSELWALDRETF